MHTEISTEFDPDSDGATWSLCWQAAVGREFFALPPLAAQIRRRLIEAHQRSGRALVDFVLLPTEIHAISSISTSDSIGSVARGFGTFVSRWVREAEAVRSPVFAGPFRAQLLDSADALRHEVRMLAWRPTVHGFCTTPTYHPHGGLRIALGLTASKGFDARPLLSLFGETVPSARESLRQWVTKRPSEQERRAWELRRGLKLATGTVGLQASTAKVVGSAAADLIAAGGGYGIDRALNLLEVWVGAKIHPTESIDLKTDLSPLGARGRALVACLAVEHQLCSAASVARHFQRAKATLSEQMAVCRDRQTDRVIVATPLARILEEAALLLSR